MRVLIIEDNEDAAFILSRLLICAGHETRIAINGEDALTQAADFQPQIALLDLWLPNMDGYDVARRLRDLKNPLRIRIIALSGVNGIDSARDQAAGIDQHLMKPASLEDILQAMVAEHAAAIPAPIDCRDVDATMQRSE